MPLVPVALLGVVLILLAISPIVPCQECPPPGWNPEYKVEIPVNAADLMGPDGTVYPDFTRAGIPEGIPEITGRECRCH